MSQTRFIYVACPWTPKGGGMFKVADYLLQSQLENCAAGYAQLRALDTRGGGSAGMSFVVLIQAMFTLIKGKLSGELAGVHVNMAERLSLFRKGVIIALCKALNIPVVLHLHAAQLHHFYRRLPNLLQGLTRWFFSLANTCVVLGQSSQRFVIDELHVAPEKVAIVINGVPAPELPKKHRSDAKFNLLFLGNLSERKGVSDLLRALSNPVFDSQHLAVTIAGGGDIAHYQQLAQQLGIADLVDFTGWADQAQAAELLSKANALILPSYDEGLPLVILEAMAASVAVICTPVGEIPSVLTDQLNACFVTPGDSASITVTIQRLINDPELRLKLQQNGRDVYLREFCMARFFANIASIHQQHFGVCAQASKSLTSGL
jgi:glycosyltransferase involved in cell wall biosynthesis